ncbi:MAG: DNA-binding protein WhiA [Clostridia bacterium]|nr:DNA-binding protein WhiA [Clostridia bacterium]
MDQHSFKTNVIEEAIGVAIDSDCCRLAFLCSMLKTIGTIEVSRRGAQALFSSDNFELISAIAKYIKAIYFTDIEVERSQYTSGTKKGNSRFELKVPKGQTKQLLTDTHTMTLDGEMFTGFVSGISREIVEYSCCAKNFVRGLFIGCGSVYVPTTFESEEIKKSEGYHLEFQLSDEQTAADLIKLLSTLGITAKSSERGANFLVYLKEKLSILHLFQILHLPEAAIKLQEIMRERELNGSINRNVICEAANLDKSYVASVMQLQAIQIIEKRDGLSSLSAQLKDTALARVSNPRLTLQELADIIGISKSCLNHRMRKILQIAGVDTNEKEK